MRQSKRTSFVTILVYGENLLICKGPASSISNTLFDHAWNVMLLFAQSVPTEELLLWRRLRRCPLVRRARLCGGVAQLCYCRKSPVERNWPNSGPYQSV